VRCRAATRGWLSFVVRPLTAAAGLRGQVSLPETRVIEICWREESPRRNRCAAAKPDNEYIFTLDDEHDLDGNVPWNPARLLNHSCAPNCEAELDEGRIWIIALRDIRAGEELTFNYGYDLENYREHPCRCGRQRNVLASSWPKNISTTSAGSVNWLKRRAGNSSCVLPNRQHTSTVRCVDPGWAEVLPGFRESRTANQVLKMSFTAGIGGGGDSWPTGIPGGYGG